MIEIYVNHVIHGYLSSLNHEFTIRLIRRVGQKYSKV